MSATRINPSPEGAARATSTRRWLWFGAAALLVLGIVTGVRRWLPGDWVTPALAWVQGHGRWAPILFIAVYVAACVLFVPGSWITLGGGALFGLWWGVVYVFSGALAGATLSFLLGRFVARDWVVRRLESYPRFRALDAAVGRDGWKIVLLTRLSPGFPFTLLNYAYGVTQVSLRDYFFASAVGMLPGTILYVYLGSLAGDLSRLRQSRARTPAEWALLGVGLVVTAILTIYVARLARKALGNKLPPATSP